MAGLGGTSGSPNPDDRLPAERRRWLPKLSDRTRRYLKARARRSAVKFVRETAKGFVIAVLILFGTWLLYQIGLIAQGQPLVFDAGSPLEFWASVTGLVLHWSQFNEWALLIVATILAVVALAAFVRWRDTRHRQLLETIGHQPFPRRLERHVASLRMVSTLGALAVMVFGAWLYQQYLWNVALPVPSGAIGVAFSRQAFSAISYDDVVTELAELGHEQSIVLRELPVGFDATDVERGRSLARRINARAIVILRDDGPAVGGGNDPSNAPSTARRFRGLVAFSDPTFGFEVPLPARASDGSITGTAYRTKEGVEVPNLESQDLGRLLEAAAGLVLYDQDRFPAAASHLRNALPPPGQTDEMEPIVRFHLANTAYLIGQDETAQTQFKAVVAALASRPAPTLSDRLVLVQSSNILARLLLQDGDTAEAAQFAESAMEHGEVFATDESALADPAIYRRAHQARAETFLVMTELAGHRQDPDGVELWSRRAADEARLLLSNADDRRARLAGNRALFLAGECVEAYADTSRYLKEQPLDDAALHLMIRLANLRDRDELRSLEAEGYLKRLFAEEPRSQIDLTLQQIQLGLRAFLVDRGYETELEDVAKEMLALDPTSSIALEEYVGDRRQLVGWPLLSPPIGLPSVNHGHIPTYMRLQTEWGRDPAVVMAVVDQASELRLDALRWARELEPGPRPLLELSEIDARIVEILGRYASSVRPGGGAADRQVRDRLVEARSTLMRDTQELIEQPGASPRQIARAHLLRGTALNNQALLTLTVPGSEGDGKALAREALSELEAARVLVESAPAPDGDTLLEYALFGRLLVAYLLGSNYAAAADDQIETERLRAAALEAAELQRAFQPVQSPAAPSPLGDCPEAAARRSALQALSEGRYPEAARLSEEYLANFPDDPAGLLVLVRARYNAGDLVGASSALTLAEAAGARIPEVAALAVVVHLAGGREVEAQNSLQTLRRHLADEPLGTQLDHLRRLADDLRSLAQRDVGARGRVGDALAMLDEFVRSLGVDRRSSAAPASVLAVDSLGMAALWAGHSAAAASWFSLALEIEPGYAPALAHRGLAAAVAGSVDEARADVAAALAAASAYGDLAPIGCLPDEPENCASFNADWLASSPIWAAYDLVTVAGEFRAVGDAFPEFGPFLVEQAEGLEREATAMAE